MSYARIQDFCLGGGKGMVQGRLQENSPINVFFFFQLFISEEINFPRYQRGSTIFQGCPTFSSVGVPNAIFNRNSYSL